MAFEDRKPAVASVRTYRIDRLITPDQSPAHVSEADFAVAAAISRNVSHTRCSSRYEMSHTATSRDAPHLDVHRSLGHRGRGHVPEQSDFSVGGDARAPPPRTARA